MIPGCYSHFLTAISIKFFKACLSFEYSFVSIPSEWILFSKKLLNGLATLDSFEIISSFSTKDIFEKLVTLPEKNDFTVLQNFLLLFLHNIFFLFLFYMIYCIYFSVFYNILSFHLSYFSNIFFRVKTVEENAVTWGNFQPKLKKENPPWKKFL